MYSYHFYILKFKVFVSIISQCIVNQDAFLCHHHQYFEANSLRSISSLKVLSDHLI